MKRKPWLVFLAIIAVTGLAAWVQGAPLSAEEPDLGCWFYCPPITSCQLICPPPSPVVGR